MLRQPLVDIDKLLLAHPALAADLHALVLLGAVGVLEMDGLEVVLEGVTTRENPRVVAAVVGRLVLGTGRRLLLRHLERTLELALVAADLLPVTLDVTEQVVGPRKAPAAVLADVWTRGGLEMRRFVGGQVGVEKLTLRTLSLFAGLPVFLDGGWLDRGK